MVEQYHRAIIIGLLLDRGIKFCCAKCDEQDIDKICFHHKDSNRNNNSWSNIELLCKKCHARTKKALPGSPQWEKRRVYMREYIKRPEVIARRKAYLQTSDFKENNKQYMHDYGQRSDVKIKRRDYYRMYRKIKKIIKQKGIYDISI